MALLFSEDDQDRYKKPHNYRNGLFERNSTSYRVIIPLQPTTTVSASDFSECVPALIKSFSSKLAGEGSAVHTYAY
jgi:hypothetical protein